eukprot:gene46410-9296_t
MCQVLRELCRCGQRVAERTFRDGESEQERRRKRELIPQATPSAATSMYSVS